MTADRADEVSLFLVDFSDRMILDWEDQLASWAALLLLSNSEEHFVGNDELRELREKVVSSDRWNRHDPDLSDVNAETLLANLLRGPST